MKRKDIRKMFNDLKKEIINCHENKYWMQNGSSSLVYDPTNCKLDYNYYYHSFEFAPQNKIKDILLCQMCDQIVVNYQNNYNQYFDESESLDFWIECYEYFGGIWSIYSETATKLKSSRYKAEGRDKKINEILKND